MSVRLPAPADIVGAAPAIVAPELAEVHAVLEGRRRWAVTLGDALDLLPKLPRGCCHLLIADMPYSSGGATRAERAKSGRAKYSKDKGSLDISEDSRDQRQWIAWCGEWLRLAAPALVPGSLVAAFVDWRQIGALELAFGLSPIVHRGTCPWWKHTGRPQKGRPRQDCEFIVWGTYGKRALEGPVLPGHYDATLPSSERDMFCSKPEALMTDLARWAPENGVVLDPFAGTGSTAAGALLAGRRAITFDIGADKVAHATKRLEALERGETKARPPRRRRSP